MPTEKAGFICWDIQGTLCNFSSVKPGISDLLGELSAEGFDHFAVTSADRDEAEASLVAVGLRRHFTGVLGREDGWEMGRKPYSVVARTVGLWSEEVRAKMLVIGDAPSDQPIIEGVVFIHHAGGANVDSSVTRDIIGALRLHGRGDFNAGFRCLDELTGGKRLTVLPSGVVFMQQEWNIDHRVETVPSRQLTPVITQIGMMPRPT